MNPDPLNPYHQMAQGRRRAAELRDQYRRQDLHKKAVARRKKAKRGGKK